MKNEAKVLQDLSSVVRDLRELKRYASDAQAALAKGEAKVLQELNSVVRDLQKVKRLANDQVTRGTAEVMIRRVRALRLEILKSPAPGIRGVPDVLTMYRFDQTPF
jgi:hypothetical protein